MRSPCYDPKVDVDRATGTIGVEPPPRLRLDALLRDLSAHASGGPGSQGFTVGDLVDRSAGAGFGFLIAVLSLIAVPFVGVSTPFGLAIALIGAQLVVGRARPWLPRRARRRVITTEMLDRVVAMLARRTRWLARMTRDRWPRMIMPRVVGLGVVVLAVGLALPLPIPGSNLMFLAPLLVYAIGLLESDGVWIALGHVGTLVDVGVLFAFGDVVARVIRHLFLR
jgi:hypothetical protein